MKSLPAVFVLLLLFGAADTVGGMPAALSGHGVQIAGPYGETDGRSEAATPPDADAAGDPYADNNCVQCHRERGGRLAEMVDLEWAKSVHYENNVACEHCHGGDASLTRDQFSSDDEFKEASHATFSVEFRFLQRRSDLPVEIIPETDASYPCRECHTWTIEQRLGNPHAGTEPLSCLFKRYGGVDMSRERGVTYICATCHPETTEKQLASPHGSRGAPSCLFCHGKGGHAISAATIEIIDPRPREELGRCSLCHKPDNMNAIAHVRETLEETEQGIKVAGEQFEVLQRFGYRSLALEEMHDHIDDVRANLRQVQHGCNLREINELAKSIENITKRVAYDYELVLALHDARRRQTGIALGVAGLLLVLIGMLLVYKKAFGIPIESWTILDPTRRSLTPPCNDGCPAGNDVRGFIAAAVKEDYDQALEILLETTPLPSVCGRVCPGPCVEACNRRLLDESINIPELERYVGDHGRWKGASQPTRRERIAVVGSGPAGLSATYHLARLGYPVTLFERDDELGGVMRTGIPAYRLSPDVLNREIERILAHGVTVRTGEMIKRDDLWGMSHEFAAVFVATGLQHLQPLDLGDAAPEAVQQGIHFLERARKGEADLEGKHVVVIGGGNVAIDVARTAVRLSAASVRLYCLEGRGEMPAHAEEIEEAEAEGIEINTGWGPLPIPAGARLESRTSSDQGKAKSVEFQRCVAVFDEGGAFAPSFDEKDRMSVEADTVILALGRLADLSILPEGSRVHEVCATALRAVYPPGSRTADTAVPPAGAPIFSGGDFAVDEGTVSAAIGSGRRAAWHIHRTLTGEDLFPPAPQPVAGPDDVKMHLFSHAPRECGRVLSPDVRRTGFAEVRLGLSDSPEHRPALAEAQRCFSCGVCANCDRCLTHCPEGAVVRDGDGYRVEYLYCQSCGTCALECPRGLIYMAELETTAAKL